MRILGLDYGDKTIGVAVSDPFGWTAQGVEIIRRKEVESYKKSIARIGELVEEMGITSFVLGYPKNMDNSEGSRCEKTRIFMEKLQLQFPDMPIVLWDERMSTIAANRSLLEGNLGAKKRKSVIDKMAAVFILQGYLDRISNQKTEV